MPTQNTMPVAFPNVSPEVAAVALPTILGGYAGERRNGKRGLGHGAVMGAGLGAGGVLGHEAAEALGAEDYDIANILAILAGAGAGGYGAKQLSVLTGLSDEEKEKKAEASPTLQKLIQAKYLSDKQQYIRKNQIVKELMHAAPKEFAISEAAKHGIVGITHIPTKFKIHTLERNLPADILQNLPEVQAVTAEKTSACVKLTSLLGV
jgi:hypothetical protein